MKDNDIRPKYLMSRQQYYCNKDAVKLLKKKYYFKTVDCPACNSKKKEYFFKKNGFSYYICKICRTFFLNPRPSEVILDKFYKESLNMKYWAKKIFPASRLKRIKHIFNPRANYLINKLNKIYKNKNKKNLSYLEIGAGDGILAREIRKKNFFQDIVLVEPNPYCAKICLKNNFSVIQDTFENALKKLKKFHCIVFFEVLEHIFSSYKFLKKCHSLLNKDGLVFFSCPNGEGFDVSLMQEYSNVIDHEHLNYFNISSINVLLKKCGFESIYIETPGSLDIDLIKQSYLSSKIEDKKYLHRINWIKNIDEYFQNEFQDFIQKNKISSHMLVIARKI